MFPLTSTCKEAAKLGTALLGLGPMMAAYTVLYTVDDQSRVSVPEVVIADQLYATRSNWKRLQENNIDHAFKLTGRPPKESGVTSDNDNYRRRQLNLPG